MDFKKKLKTRLYIAVTYTAIGIFMIILQFGIKEKSDFLSSFGFAMAIMGLIRIRNYFIITKSEESIRKREIAETDERNISIMLKAKNAAFSVYMILSGIAVIVLSCLNQNEKAIWIAYSVLLLVFFYWISYMYFRKKS